MANERTTETIVRDHLQRYAAPGQIVEEQVSSDPAIRRALAAASKSGAGAGKPEFIVRIPDAPNLVIVVECKASVRAHQSAERDRPDQFAVDGVLHYAAHLSRHFDVIGVAVSGTKARDLRVSTFRQLRREADPEVLAGPNGPVTALAPVLEYRRLLTFDPAVRARTHAELITFSRVLHNFMRDYAKLSEAEKPLVVSGILLGLQDEAFNAIWDKLGSKDLARELFNAIDRQARRVGLTEEKRQIMLAPYAFITTHPELSKRGRDGSEEPLRRLVRDIDSHVRPFIDTYHDVDVLGHFYGEFLRYTGGDKKGLGIVLTPHHLTELFARIANVGPADTVVDTCAGTCGFLIAAMAEMDKKVGQRPTVHQDIRAHRLVGVEQQPHMYALAVCNMILRGDGKANLYQGSCFEENIVAALSLGVEGKHERPNVGLINPPFSQKGEGLHELDFVETLLDCLVPGGLAVAVLPMSCAIEPHPRRTQLLSHHTLVAAMSLPNDLFHPVGVITCAMVFQAHQPHEDAAQATWFGYWKDDGFEKTKDRGRIDLHERWDAIRDRWLDDFHSRRVVPGRSVVQRVTAADEWCAEAYMETDYTRLRRKDFEAQLKRFAIYRAIQRTADFQDDSGGEGIL
ncbi:MAG TPA: N-6 DNA methylase [Solirubrobacteraceae bacterium]|nr:N-6 DNA methylase [Solirubrobacteraceae bacterium]